MREAIAAWEHWLLQVVSGPKAGIPDRSRQATTWGDKPRPTANNHRDEPS
jgi:hypothetical protein